MDTRHAKTYVHMAYGISLATNVFFGSEFLLDPLPVDIAEDTLLFQVVSKTLKIAASSKSRESHDFDLNDIQSDFFNPDVIISPINERTADSAPDDHQGPKVNVMTFHVIDNIIWTLFF